MEMIICVDLFVHGLYSFNYGPQERELTSLVVSIVP